MDKSHLRKHLRHARQHLSKEVHARASRQCARLMHYIISSCDHPIVAAYYPMHHELDIMPLLNELAQDGITTLLPIITQKHGPLSFHRYHPDDSLVDSTDFITLREPIPGGDEVIPNVMIVPLLGFDRLGHRLGYGAGYYDRTLQQLRAEHKILAIGVGFDMQEVDHPLPASPHDQPLDMIITETRIIHIAI